MRDHKYRGLTKDGKWMYGYHFADDELKRHFIIPDFECTGGLIKTDGRYGDFINAFIEVDPATVGEFTGKKDSKRRDIYENDNLSFTVFDHNDIDTQFAGQVYWDEEDLAWNIQCKPEVFSLGDILRQDDSVEVIDHAQPEGEHDSRSS